MVHTKGHKVDVSQLAKEGLGWAVAVVLASVVVYQNRKLEFLYKEKDSLQEQRRIDIIAIIEKYSETVGDFSQTAKLLLAKLSSGDK